MRPIIFLLSGLFLITSSSIHAMENDEKNNIEIIENENINDIEQKNEEIEDDFIIHKGIEISEFGLKINSNLWESAAKINMNVMRQIEFKHKIEKITASYSNFKLKAPYEPLKQAHLENLKKITTSSELVIEQDMTVNGVPVKFWQVNAIYINGVSTVTLALIYNGEKEYIQIFITAEASEFPHLEEQMKEFLFGLNKLN